MPRRDRTFTDIDIFRFIFTNLDELERSALLERLGLELQPPPPPSGNITEEDITFLGFFVDVASLFLNQVTTILDAGVLLGNLMNQADIEEARNTGILLNLRRRGSQILLEGIDF